MSKNKRFIADSLFAVQIICTIIFGGGQFLKMLNSAKGVSMSWFIFWEIFLVINLALATKAHKNQPDRVTWQIIGSYSLWIFMVGADLGVMLWKKTGTWDSNDTLTSIIAGTGIAATLVIANRSGNGISDPIIKGWLAVFFKAIPQLMMAAKIFSIGTSDLAIATIVAGHITVLTRIGQLAFSINKARLDHNQKISAIREQKGSALSEFGNEISWAVVTIVWWMN